MSNKPKKVFIMPPPVTHPCGSITLSLPYPPKDLTPNSQRGQSRWAAIAKSRVVKEHREIAKLAMADVMRGRAYCGEFAGYGLASYSPTAAVRDVDNNIGSAKSYLDGCCDCLGISDKLLEMVKLPTREKDANCPRMEITFYSRERLSEDMKSQKRTCRQCGFSE